MLCLYVCEGVAFLSSSSFLTPCQISQLWQLKNDVNAVENKISKVGQALDALTLTQETLDEEIANKTKLVTSCQAKISSYNTLIQQKQHTIECHKKKISEIAARTGVRGIKSFVES